MHKPPLSKIAEVAAARRGACPAPCYWQPKTQRVNYAITQLATLEVGIRPAACCCYGFSFFLAGGRPFATYMRRKHFAT